MDYISYECERIAIIKNSPEYKELHTEMQEAIKNHGWHSPEHIKLRNKLVEMQGLKIYKI